MSFHFILSTRGCKPPNYKGILVRAQIIFAKYIIVLGNPFIGNLPCLEYVLTGVKRVESNAGFLYT